MNEVSETTQYDVKLPQPRTRKVLMGVLVAVLLLGTIGIAAAAIANRTAQAPGDVTASVMPPDTMMYFALNTHSDQLPNFNVIADAWKDSKEAKMLASGLELAFTQAGLNWEEDVQPWLGDRVGLGLVDFGSLGQAKAADSSSPHRAPFFIVAAQTKDRAKSDAFLAALGKQLSETGSHQSVQTETYRNVPLSYLTSSDTQDSAVAWATVNDSVVLTLNPDNLKLVINAALDGQNLAASANYKAVMSALPDQNAGAAYLDYNRYFEQIMEMSKNISSSLDSMTSKLDAQQAEKFKKMQAGQEAQLAQLREMMKALGGVGATLSYEPNGIRFDTAMQFDPAQLPAEQRQMYESALTQTTGHIFASLPASAILAVDFNLKGGFLKAVTNPDVLAAQFGSLGMSKEDITAKQAELQKMLGLNLQTDIFDLMNGDAGFAILSHAQEKSDATSYSMPFEAAVLLDSSDATKLADNFDKLMQNLSALSPDASVKVQSLSGLPYSVILMDGKPVLTYGVVDGRFVIGSTSNTLLAIDHADQSSLADEATFKQATGLLPANRLNTAYLNLQPLWDLIDARTQGETTGVVGAVPNYLKHFKWISGGAEAPADGLARGSLHIGVGQ